MLPLDAALSSNRRAREVAFSQRLFAFFLLFFSPNKVQLEEGFPPLPLGELAPRANRQLAGGALGEVRMD